jgi:hypothetical protein
MKASMKSVMKNSMNKIMKESDLEYKNFLPKILCGAKNIGVCGSKKKTKNDRFVVTATINRNNLKPLLLEKLLSWLLCRSSDNFSCGCQMIAVTWIATVQSLAAAAQKLPLESRQK